MILFLRELLGPLGHLFSRPHFMASVSLACTENVILEIIAQPYYASKTLKKMFLGLCFHAPLNYMINSMVLVKVFFLSASQISESTTGLVKTNILPEGIQIACWLVLERDNLDCGLIPVYFKGDLKRVVPTETDPLCREEVTSWLKPWNVGHLSELYSYCAKDLPI